ncbi:DUF4956 domain-containing protein [Peloplasma aerotolerans]|jgi:hypothetical protein|uniref:DUF4956 domain-containing protein n=1 Tax=Peloplasma aerotolerans TaxID=3044389 RepID=A0AAW6UBU7_9MOLU|nr:DUF4956 domain-containing protein [Mariniplasma sp. M4Ah]MDI6453618.1 DUF4956 domain-containing protein [Mariniplasma sp. M4Ah]
MTTFFITIDIMPLTLGALLTVLITSTILGGILSLVYIFTHKNTVYDQSFSMTLFLLPLVISIIVLLISDNLARAFSLAGVFTLVRFRTAIADSRDITYILSTVGIALASAMGFVGIAIIFTAFISIILIILHSFRLDKDSNRHAKLKIVIPENLNYSDVFNDVFKKYLNGHQLQRVKTTDFGTMFELTYLIKLKPDTDQKEFLDELRVRNGNLSITLSSDYVSLTSE